MKKRIFATLLATIMIMTSLVILPASAETSGDWDYTVIEGEAKLRRYCGSDTEVTIPDEIDGYPVTGLSYWTEGDHVRGIFRGRSVTSVTIPASVKTIDADAFFTNNQNDLLTRVNITDLDAWCRIRFGSIASNPVDSSHNLYLNGGPVTDVVFPDGLTSVGHYAFTYCTSLASVTIPDGVTEIGRYAFAWCDSLKSIIIPGSVTTINDNAFYSCDSLTTVYFGGTSDEWKEMRMRFAVDKNDALLTANVVFYTVRLGFPGDVSSDGTLNAKDVTGLMRLLVGWADDGVFPKAADYNGDGRVNARDVYDLMRFLVNA